MENKITMMLIASYKSIVESANMLDGLIEHLEKCKEETPCFVPLVDIDRLTLLRTSMVMQIMVIENIFKNDFEIDVDEIIKNAQKREEV